MIWTFFLLVLVNVLLIHDKVDSVGSMVVDYDVTVDLTSATGNMTRIWDNTGLSPPGPGNDAVSYLSSKEQFINLGLIGSLPFKGISHVRIHWLLDLIRINSTVTGHGRFDYQILDNLIWWLKMHRMKPGFELMGNPGNVFSDLNNNPITVILWQDFITSLTNHYIEKYGQDVSNWRFELWNEPDSKQYNILNLTSSGYLKYAFASMKGLAVNNLKVSGPAGTFKDFKHHNNSWSLLQWCNTMMAVTGSCGIETITFHKKGDGLAQQVVSNTLEFYSTAISIYPLLKNLPFANNEADILTGWWREEEWRGDVNYATQVCEVITYLLAEIEKQNLSLAYISNDNGFINQFPAYFNQRTLLTRFQMNISNELHYQFVRKPVMVAMALLSYLGPTKMPVFRRHKECSSNCDSRLSVLAAGDGVDINSGWSAAVVFAVSDLKKNCSDKTFNLNLRLPENIEITYVVYQIDNVLTNPKSIWEKSGKPDNPNGETLIRMREHEGPHVAQTGSIIGDWAVISLKIRCPSVTMVHMCARSHKVPGKVLHLHAMNVTFNEVLLLWQDSDTRCVRTYEVYFCSGVCLTNQYKKITDITLIMLSYQFRASGGSDTAEATRGRYKVRVLDYWDQPGLFSDVLLYP